VSWPGALAAGVLFLCGVATLVYARLPNTPSGFRRSAQALAIPVMIVGLLGLVDVLLIPAGAQAAHLVIYLVNGLLLLLIALQLWRIMRDWKRYVDELRRQQMR
jgi:heme A synthase